MTDYHTPLYELEQRRRSRNRCRLAIVTSIVTLLIVWLA